MPLFDLGWRELRLEAVCTVGFHIINYANYTLWVFIYPSCRDRLEARLGWKELRRNGRKHEGIFHGYGVVCDGH